MENNNKKELFDVANEYIAKIDSLDQSLDSNYFDVHKNNLYAKLQNTAKSISGNKKKKKNNAESPTEEDDEEFDNASFLEPIHIINFVEPYIKYRTSLYELMGKSEGEYLNGAIEYFIDYKSKASLLNSETKRTKNGKLYFSSQSKYEPTIIEEFIGFLLYPLLEKFTGFICGPIDAYTEMNIQASINNKNLSIDLKQKTKNQDFAIYSQKLLTIDGEKDKIAINIPIVAIECKTYIDKNMLEGSLNTAQRIKKGNPNSKFYIVSETYDLKADVDINPHEIDNIYIIRKCKRRAKSPVEPLVLTKLYEQIKNDLTNLGKIRSPINNIIDYGILKP